ncbi:unnamed protein product [Jaminaea pallidilutea]
MLTRCCQSDDQSVLGGSDWLRRSGLASSKSSEVHDAESRWIGCEGVDLTFTSSAKVAAGRRRSSVRSATTIKRATHKH